MVEIKWPEPIMEVSKQDKLFAFEPTSNKTSYIGTKEMKKEYG